ncbi:LysR family transcriptional regulator [Cupriavidus necator]|uniref:LysR family transcriptional regulator n=1 Tax=Cupriavidus necator TaxID=106590 RepID=UPI0039C4C777
MKHVNLATVDLNLLKTFLAIWELRSLTAAADKLHLSQPAVSHALRRLREVFDDPLFVRTPTAMVPTDAAIRLHAPIDNAMSIIYGALQKHSRFDPSVATRTFRLVMSDMAEQHVLPLLMETLASTAPNITIDVRQMSMDDLCSAMRNGDADIALGYLPALNDECVSSPMLDDEFVCMLRSAHPFQGKKLTVADLGSFRYVYAETNTTGHCLAEDAFRRAGIERDVALRLRHFTVAARIVAGTDLALILPRSIAEGMNRGRIYRLFPLPIEMPSITVKVYTHSRFASDPGIGWLAATLLTLFASEESVAH